MESSGKPPSNNQLSMLKALLVFLPEDTVRTLLPILHIMELKELFRRFRWEDTHLLHAGTPPENMSMDRILNTLMEHIDPEQREQFSMLQQMMEMMSSMQGEDMGDMQSIFEQFGQMGTETDS